MKPDQLRLTALLTDTVTLLCKNSLNYKRQLRIEGVLGITIDESDVFIVHLNESVAKSLQEEVVPSVQNDNQHDVFLMDKNSFVQNETRVKMKDRSVEEKTDDDVICSSSSSSSSSSSQMKKSNPLNLSTEMNQSLVKDAEVEGNDSTTNEIIIKEEPTTTDDSVMIIEKMMQNDGQTARIRRRERLDQQHWTNEIDRSKVNNSRRLTADIMTMTSSSETMSTTIAKNDYSHHDQKLEGWHNVEMMTDNIPVVGDNIWQNFIWDKNQFAIPYGKSCMTGNGEYTSELNRMAGFGSYEMECMQEESTNSRRSSMGPRGFSLVKPYACPEVGCNRRFFHRNNVYRHRKQKHSHGNILGFDCRKHTKSTAAQDAFYGSID